jgi:hypothetical protein
MSSQRFYMENYRLFRGPQWGRGKPTLRAVGVQDVPGKPSTLMAEPPIGELAEKFKRPLRAAQQEAYSG